MRPIHPERGPDPRLSTEQIGRIVHYDATQRRRDRLRAQALGNGNGHDDHGNGNGHARPATVATRPAPLPPPPAALPPLTLPAVAPGVAPAPLAAAKPPLPPVTAPLPPAAAPLPPVAASAPAAASGALATLGQVEQFLVNFVVEQTGYAPAVVRMDSDLEADLGIDSIKKARLFGELREYFDLQPDAGMTLDSFPTLGTIRDYLAKKMSKPAAPVASAPSARTVPLTSPAPIAAAPLPTPPAPVLPTPLAPPKPLPSITAAPAAVLKPAFATASVAPAPAAAAPVPAARPASSSTASSKLDGEQLQAFLVNFVVEQTGYAPSVVRMDSDLEADLGIDSIKKARLFGELREYFDVQPDPTVTLDSFPTLGSIRDYLLSR